MKALSKSEYLMFLKHPAWLWLKRHDKSKLPEPDANQQAIFDAGNLFERYAEARFKNIQRVGFENYQQYTSMPKRTQELLKNAKTITQARFEADFDEHHKITCITDVIEKVSSNVFDLYEIKSSTKVKPEHIEDLAFQVVVLESMGYRVRKIGVIFCNNRYTRNGEIDPLEISVLKIVSSEVRSKIEGCKKSIAQAFECIEQANMPDPTPRRAKLGSFWEWLQIYTTLQPESDNYSIYKLAQIKPDQLGQLEDMHIESMHDVPSGFLLKPVQKLQIEAVKSGKPLVKKESISNFLNNLKYPLQFLDYETLGSVIPPFDGLRPYQQLPFQYSLHVIKSPGAELEHYEFLHKLNTDPTQNLLENLKTHIKPTGTVLVWYEGFEKTCNQLLANRQPEYKDFINDLNARIADLMIPFQKGWYVDADFYGSASIKNVLPVIAPELSYKDMEISEGATAQRLWMSAVYEDKYSPQEIDKIMKDLLVYCELDTYAMVKIYEFLTSLVNSSESNPTNLNVITEAGDQLSFF